MPGTAYVFKDRHAGISLGAEYALVNELAFKGGEKLSAIALSKQSPSEPIGGTTPISRERFRKVYDVYWLP